MIFLDERLANRVGFKLEARGYACYILYTVDMAVPLHFFDTNEDDVVYAYPPDAN